MTEPGLVWAQLFENEDRGLESLDFTRKGFIIKITQGDFLLFLTFLAYSLLKNFSATFSFLRYEYLHHYMLVLEPIPSAYNNSGIECGYGACLAGSLHTNTLPLNSSLLYMASRASLVCGPWLISNTKICLLVFTLSFCR